jgi:hypothetical protein
MTKPISIDYAAKQLGSNRLPSQKSAANRKSCVGEYRD